jgi:HTH-type transcriptional regulator/antitoxin HigA
MEPADVTTPPGAVLARTLKTLGMTQAELARRTGLTTKHVNQVIKHDVPISPAVAAAVGEATGIPAEVWIVLDAVYRVQQIGMHPAAS